VRLIAAPIISRNFAREIGARADRKYTGFSLPRSRVLFRI